MFERFSPDARTVMVLAQEEARALGHGHIGTEHLVVGIVLIARHDAALLDVLARHTLTPDTVRRGLAERFGDDPDAEHGQIPITDHAQHALEAAISRASDTVMPAHVLLGCCAADDTGATALLAHLGVDAEQLSADVAVLAR